MYYTMYHNACTEPVVKLVAVIILCTVPECVISGNDVVKITLYNMIIVVNIVHGLYSIQITQY